MSEKIPEHNSVAPEEGKQERRIPLNSFVGGERVNVPLLDAELVALRDRTTASLRAGVDEAAQKLFSSGAFSDSRKEAERVLKVHINNLAQVVGWEEAKRYEGEARERFAAKENATEKGGTSGALSKTGQVLRSLFSGF